MKISWQWCSEVKKGYAVSQIAENSYKVCDIILDLLSSYGKLVRKKKAA